MRKETVEDSHWIIKTLGSICILIIVSSVILVGKNDWFLFYAYGCITYLLGMVLDFTFPKIFGNRKVFKGSNHNHSKDNNRVLGVNSP